MAAPLLGADGRRVREWRVHEYQAQLLEAGQRFLVFVAGRRCGKTHAAAMWVLMRVREALARKQRGQIWVVYPRYEDGETAWVKLLELTPRGWITGVVRQHPRKIRFGNVEVVFKSAKEPEGLVSVGLLALWMDECGYIPAHAWEEKLKPTLIDYRAPALFTGTPTGHTFYYDIFLRGWNKLESEYRSFGLSVTQGLPSYLNPFLPREDFQPSKWTQRAYKQEILAEFLANEGAVFRDVTPGHVVQGGAVVNGYAGFSEKPTVSMGVDLARRADFTVIVGMDEGGRVTYFDRLNKIDWPYQLKIIEAAWEKLGRPQLWIDSTGLGDSFVGFARKTFGLSLRPYEMTARSKADLIETLIVAWESAKVMIPQQPELIAELLTFEFEQSRRTGHTRYSAPEGRHDDTVVSLALAWWGARRGRDLGITI